MQKMIRFKWSKDKEGRDVGTGRFLKQPVTVRRQEDGTWRFGLIMAAVRANECSGFTSWQEARDHALRVIISCLTERLSFSDAIDVVEDIVEEVKTELEEWQSGLEGTNLANSEKFEELEQAISTLDGIDFDVCFPKAPVGLEFEHLTFFHDPMTLSRNARLGTAAELLRRVSSELTESRGEVDDGDTSFHDFEKECKEVADQLEALADEIDSVECPGMF